MRFMVRLFALILVLASAAAQAQSVYRWADAEGNVHYTDDASTIPKGAAVFATDGDPISEMGAPPPVAKKPVEQAAVRPGAVSPSSSDPAVPTNSELYWRGAFHAAREKIHQLEDEIASDRRKVEENGLPISNRYHCYPGYGNTAVFNGGTAYPVGTTPYGNCIQTINPEYQRAKDRIETNRRGLERAKEDLADLERRAAFQAVPNEWRR